MATLREALKSKLEADTTLMAILTGGIYYRGVINRTDTPSAYDSRGVLKPCAVLAMSTDVARFPGQPDLDAAYAYFFVWFYDDPASNFANIDDAIARARSTLEAAALTLEAGKCYQVIHADDVADTYDDALRANARYSRYYAVLKRT